MATGSMIRLENSAEAMRYALERAHRGIGLVEPNPPVGAILVNEQHQLVGEGWHQSFGGPHAEVHALQQAGARAPGATLYVTLEPCCHQGKTPPCTQAVIAAGIRRVVVATTDPNPRVAGKGIEELRAAGISVEIGVLQSEAERLIAPFRKLITQRVPWIIAKWAMTLDGKIATHTGDSRWISNEKSRHLVHELRGRMDAILIGSKTVIADNPELTARPAGPRTAVRVVVDSRARISLNSKLVTSARETPVLVAVTNQAAQEKVSQLEQLGVEVFPCRNDGSGHVLLSDLLNHLGQRNFTNVLVEGGGQLLGTLFDQQAIDEVYAFIAPKLTGGLQAATPLAGRGIEWMSEARTLIDPEIRQLGTDVLVHGRLPQQPVPPPPS